jgi:hypothetical protein
MRMYQDMSFEISKFLTGVSINTSLGRMRFNESKKNYR